MRLRKKKSSIKKRVAELEFDLKKGGGFFANTTKDRIDALSSEVRNLTNSLNTVSKRTKELEKILYDANILEEIDLSDVQYREELEFSATGGLQVKKVPYVINQVRTK